MNILSSVPVLIAALIVLAPAQAAGEDLYVSSVLTDACFTNGIEGPACDADGVLYAVNYAREGTIGMVTPDGACSLFAELPPGSTGNGIRFDSRGDMFVADYTGHTIIRIDMDSRSPEIFASIPTTNQPNDLAITSTDIIFASDPDWRDGVGRVWRVGPAGDVSLAAELPGTTNGIEVAPGDSLLYVVERGRKDDGSYDDTIVVFDLSHDGVLSNRRLFARFTDGHVDGMRCDVDGNLYCARPSKGVVTKVSHSGEILRDIALHGGRPTNVAFGGPDGRDCHVTVSRANRIETFRVERPGRSWMLLRGGDPSLAEAGMANAPAAIALDHPHPNPFNPATVIGYTVTRPSTVELAIFNTLGQKVAMPVSGHRGPGRYTVTWDASGMPAGVYFCRVSSGGRSDTRKMMLLR